MIEYTPLWKTLQKKAMTTYTLRNKFNVSGSTIQRLKNNESVSTNTINDLCIMLDCDMNDIIEFKITEEEKEVFFNLIKRNCDN